MVHRTDNAEEENVEGSLINCARKKMSQPIIINLFILYFSSLIGEWLACEKPIRR